MGDIENLVKKLINGLDHHEDIARITIGFEPVRDPTGEYESYIVNLTSNYLREDIKGEKGPDARCQLNLDKGGTEEPLDRIKAVIYPKLRTISEAGPGYDYSEPVMEDEKHRIYIILQDKPINDFNAARAIEGIDEDGAFEKYEHLLSDKKTREHAKKYIMDAIQHFKIPGMSGGGRRILIAMEEAGQDWEEVRDLLLKNNLPNQKGQAPRMEFSAQYRLF